MQQKDFEALEEAINNVLTRAPGRDVLEFLNHGHSEQRMLWDFLWVVPQEAREPIMTSIYGSGCNDRHVETALRHILPL